MPSFATAATGGVLITRGFTDNCTASNTSRPAKSIAVANLKSNGMLALSAEINALITLLTLPPAKKWVSMSLEVISNPAFVDVIMALVTSAGGTLRNRISRRLSRLMRTPDSWAVNQRLTGRRYNNTNRATIAPTIIKMGVKLGSIRFNTFYSAFNVPKDKTFLHVIQKNIFFQQTALFSNRTANTWRIGNKPLCLAPRKLDPTVTMDIIPVNNEQLAQSFVTMAPLFYSDDPNYIRPLDSDVHQVFDRNANPRYRTGDCARWLLRDDSGRFIGRIAAFYSTQTFERDEFPVGGCGFFECTDNQLAANLLFDT